MINAYFACKTYIGKRVDKTLSNMLLSYQQNAIVIVNYGKMSSIFFGQSAINIHCQQMTEKNPHTSFILEKQRGTKDWAISTEKGHFPMLFLRLYKKYSFPELLEISIFICTSMYLSHKLHSRKKIHNINIQHSLRKFSHFLHKIELGFRCNWQVWFSFIHVYGQHFKLAYRSGDLHFF